MIEKPMAEPHQGIRLSSPSFNVYGYQFQVEGDCDQAIEGLSEDFAFFAASTCQEAVRLELIHAEPDYDALPVSDARVYTPRNVVYRDGTKRILDFGGRGVGFYDPGARLFRMESPIRDLVYEAGYLFLLSQIGQFLDATGLHRLHALAMSYKGQAILVPMPMGGGKSTLGNALLKHQGIEILSDDSPFIDRAGHAHAFPLRLGLLPGREHEVPAEHRRCVKRMGFGDKHLVNYSYFADRVASDAKPGLLLLGRRTLARRGHVREASYSEAMSSMVPNLIVGLGLFQGLEYLLERSSREIAGKASLAVSRTRNAHALVRKSRNYVLHMGRDPGANAELVLELAARHFG